MAVVLAHRVLFSRSAQRRRQSWQKIILTDATLVALQQALKRAGFDPGREDGRVDERTMNAVRAFQQAKSLPVDSERYINMATVKALGVTP